MQATIHIRIPHVRDSLIVANVGRVTNAVAVPKMAALTESNQVAIPLWEAR